MHNVDTVKSPLSDHLLSGQQAVALQNPLFKTRKGNWIYIELPNFVRFGLPLTSPTMTAEWIYLSFIAFYCCNVETEFH